MYLLFLYRLYKNIVKIGHTYISNTLQQSIYLTNFKSIIYLLGDLMKIVGLYHLLNEFYFICPNIVFVSLYIFMENISDKNCQSEDIIKTLDKEVRGTSKTATYQKCDLVPHLIVKLGSHF